VEAAGLQKLPERPGWGVGKTAVMWYTRLRLSWSVAFYGPIEYLSQLAGHGRSGAASIDPDSLGLRWMVAAVLRESRTLRGA